MPDNSIVIANNISACMSAPLARVPANLFSTRDLALPLSAAELLANFGDTFNPLNQTITNQTSNTSSTFSTGNSVSCPFLLRAVGAYIKVSPLMFALTGRSQTAPALGSNTDLVAFNGEVVTNADGTRPAAYEHGGPALRAAIAFLHSYYLEMQLGCKFSLFQERLADIGAVGSDTCLSGMGTALVPATPFIRTLNDRQRTLATGRMFIPQTVADSGDPDVADLILPPPLVPYQSVVPSLSGQFGGLYSVRPMILYPQMPITLNFRRIPGTDNFYNDMIRELSDLGEMTYDASLSTTLDNAAAAAIGYSSTMLFKSGLLSLGVIFKGFELTNACCLDYYMNPDYGAFSGALGELYGQYAPPIQIQQLLYSKHQGGLAGLIQDRQRADLSKALAA